MAQDKIEEILNRSVLEVIDLTNLEKKLQEGKKLRIKLGIDPTSPNIHLGRAVPLLKLRDFQQLGHQIVFIVGDFTGVIGDTSDKESERPMLTAETVKQNMASYVEQAGKLLDISKVEVHFNSEWLQKLNFGEIGFLADKFSVADFISRENIKKRLDSGKRVSLREVLYPLMQGYDSVAVKADVELGGTDQRFNLLAGRTLQQAYDQTPQDVIMNELIPGTDGRKMSSSWGNTINLTDSARDMFGKVMSIPDDLIVPYFTHCTRVAMEKIEKIEQLIKQDKVNPRDVKLDLAVEITALYYDKTTAEAEKDYFISTFSQKVTPQDIILVKIEKEKAGLIEILKQAFESEKSVSEIRRTIEQGGVSVDDEKITDPNAVVELQKPVVLKFGKRNWFKISK